MKMIENIEVKFMLWLQSKRNPILNISNMFITLFGNAIIYYVIAGILLFKNRNLGIKLFIIIGLEALIVHVLLKRIIKRERPFVTYKDIIPIGRIPQDKSWPSGHTSIIFGCAILFLLNLPSYIGIPSILLATLVGFSRFYLGVHYPSDVVGGILVAVIINLLIVIIA